MVINTLATFYVFTPMHDGCHGSIATTSSGYRWLNDAIGFACSVMFPLPYHAFKYMHLQHHKHTNDPLNDPDHYVAQVPPSLYADTLTFTTDIQGPTYLLPVKWFTIEVLTPTRPFPTFTL